VVFAAGTVLALGLALRAPPLGRAIGALADPVRRVSTSLASVLAMLDAALRQWAVAGIALIAVALAFGMAMLKGG